MNFLDLANFKLETILLTFFRVSGLFMIAPFFSQQGIPAHFRLMIALAIAMIMSPVVAEHGIAIPHNLIELLSLALRETLVGVVIGFVFHALFVGVQMAGTFIGFQIGFAIVNVIDPTSSEEVSILAQYKFLIAILIFFLLDGHHMMLQSLLTSYRLVPLGEGIFRIGAHEEIGWLATGIFLIALKLAAPVMATLVLTDVGLGVISRTVPQMNIFVVGFPLKIMLGLLFMGAALPIFGYVFSKALTVFNQESYKFINLMAR